MSRLPVSRLPLVLAALVLAGLPACSADDSEDTDGARQAADDLAAALTLASTETSTPSSPG